MSKKSSQLKEIFEDVSLSDLQKYKKISNLQNRGPKFWNVIIGLNAIVLLSLLFVPNVEIDNPNSRPIVAFKELKN